MIVPKEDTHIEMLKRAYYNPYYYNNNSGWHRYRWLLWLLVLIPIFFVLLMFCLRRRRSKGILPKSQPQQSYVPPEQPQTYQTGGYNNYGNEGYGNYGPSSGGAAQQGYYSREQEYDVAGEEFSRPEGPPPAHTKA
ncbi:unnamed protein product [Candida parapsilosis]